MRIFLVILFSLFILVKIIDLYDDYRIKKKYGALNNLKIEEVETLPIDQVSYQLWLYRDLYNYLKEDKKNDEEIDRRIKHLFPKFHLIKNKWVYLAHKKISKVFEKRKK